jgi:hypothetical protein
MIIKTLKIAKRWIMIVFGFTLLLLGVVLAIPGVPGPGILVVWAGLAILGACPRIRMCRAHGACELSSRREEEAMRGHR